MAHPRGRIGHAGDLSALGRRLPCLLVCYWVGIIVRLVAERVGSRVLARRSGGREDNASKLASG
jgi:hypothetical protein